MFVWFVDIISDEEEIAGQAGLLEIYKRSKEDANIEDLVNPGLKKMQTEDFSADKIMNSSFLERLKTHPNNPNNINSVKLTNLKIDSKIRNSKYKPEKNTNPYFIIIGIFNFENQTGNKYATRKEIKTSFKKLHEVFLLHS